MDSGQSSGPPTVADEAGFIYFEHYDNMCRALYYSFVQRGFCSIVTRKLLLIFRALLVGLAIAILAQCIDYDSVRRYKEINSNINTSVSIFYMFKRCEVSHYSEWMYLGAMAAIVVFLGFREFLPICSYIRAKNFYVKELNISQKEMSYYKWQNFLEKWRNAMKTVPGSADKIRDELELNHRILRFENLMIGLSSKGLLPTTEISFFNVKIFTRVCLFNVKVLIFSGWFAPFEQNWRLKANYKKKELRDKLASTLAWRIIGLILMHSIIGVPFLLWRIIYGLLKFVDIVRQNPGILCRRSWSTYAKIQLRSYNELAHELEERLSRAYRPTKKYLDGFSSPMASLCAKTSLFGAALFSTAIIYIALINDDILTATRTATIMMVLGFIISASLPFIANGKAWEPEHLLHHVAEEIQILPSGWEKQVCNLEVRDELEKALPLQWKLLVFEVFLAPFFTIINLGKMLCDAKSIVEFLQNEITTKEYGDVYEIDRCFEIYANKLKISCCAELLQLLFFPRNCSEEQVSDLTSQVCREPIVVPSPVQESQFEAIPLLSLMHERQTSREPEAISSENDCYLPIDANETHPLEQIECVQNLESPTQLPTDSNETTQGGRVLPPQPPIQSLQSRHICKHFECKKELSMIRFALANPLWALSQPEVMGYVEWMKQAIETEFGHKRGHIFWRTFSDFQRSSIFFSKNLRASASIIRRVKNSMQGEPERNEPANCSDTNV